MPHPYATEPYAATLQHLGRVVAVPEWDCHVIARPTAGGGEDLLGCYPISTIDPKADLRGGLARLRSDGYVSVTLVCDDFHRPPLSALNETFDVVRPFKTHYIHKGGLQLYKPGRNHQYKINRAFRTVDVKIIELKNHLDAWEALYAELVDRRRVMDTHLFTRASFTKLAEIPGVHAIGGFVDGTLVACHLWVSHSGHVHSHLVASNAEGYAQRASYAVSDASVRYFADAEIINFGGGAGVIDDIDNGLARFKRGFSNATAASYICGAILDPVAYASLCLAAPRTPEANFFFPAYRAPTPLDAKTGYPGERASDV